jgi:hypothetical protein
MTQDRLSAEHNSFISLKKAKVLFTHDRRLP